MSSLSKAPLNIDKSTTACLIIGFLRPDGVKRLLNSISNAGLSAVYLAVDGPRNNEEALVQDALIYNAEQHCLSLNLRLHTWRREVNLGLAVSVISALNWFFEHEESGIIFEDDLEPHPDFFSFACKSLKLYEGDPEVWMISGNQYFSNHVDKNLCSWSTYPLIWGWATWRSSWVKMESLLLNRISMQGKIDSFRVRHFLEIGQKRALSGFTESWAVPLSAAMHLAQKYCILPPVNLVANLGDDAFAIHTKEIEQGGAFTTYPLPSNFEFSNTNRLEVSLNIDHLIEDNIYKIRFRHNLLPFYSFVFDRFRFRKKKAPLKSRVRVVTTP